MTSETKISDLFQISGRFLRSIHLERDFNDPDILKDYILSDYSVNCLRRISKGLETASGHRAWRITGDYGTGKSSFALFLAHWLSGRVEDYSTDLGKRIDYAPFTDNPPRFVPVLVTGSRAPLGPAIVEGIRTCLFSSGSNGKTNTLMKKLENALQSNENARDDQIVELVMEANHYAIRSGQGNGLIVVIDELGKFLEFSALYPEKQDVYLLQRLAEAASRSREKPFFIIGLLHQGFNAYADQLAQSAQREWEKVASRFEELVFNQPLEQMSTLIASALRVRTDRFQNSFLAAAKAKMAAAIDIGWYGAAPAKQLLMENAAKLYPIHPTVLPVLIRVFNRFGQNERSLFSFLLSNEPYGLQHFAEKNLENGLNYRLCDLYDYVHANFGYRLVVQTYRSHWNHIDSMIESFSANSELELKILKTVGILNLVNQHDLLATEDSVQLSLAGPDLGPGEIAGVMKNLRENRHVLYFRGAAGGFCLWPHTSVDLDQAYGNASKAIGQLKNVAGIVKNHIDSTPVVARRHYIQTGNLRYFSIQYCSVSNLVSTIKNMDDTADGMIIVPLCETMSERKTALELADHPKLKSKPEVLMAVPPPLHALEGLVQEAQRWEWIAKNTPELNTDRFAAEEVSRRKEYSRSALLRRINSFIGLRQFTGALDLELFRKGKRISVANGRDLLSELSNICDEVYCKGPRLKNELVNRRIPSSAAAAARMRIIEKMLRQSDKPLLGMDSKKKPPEMSVYLSVLKQSMLHQQYGNTWKIGLPKKDSDRCGILPVFKQIEKIVKSKPDSRIPLSKIYKELSSPPFGVREGLIPIFLAAFKLMHEHEIAFYEEGSFLKTVFGEEFQRLIKCPENFEIQYCKIDGIRIEFFYKILGALELDKVDAKPEILDIVQPLCVFASDLPQYVQNTKRLSNIAISVRNAILAAREPVKLLFEDLPLACDFDPINEQSDIKNETDRDFVRCLKDALIELKMAYPELRERLKRQLLNAFDYAHSFSKMRKSVAARAEHLAIAISEPKLKAFCLRLMDENLPEVEWIESVGSYLVSKPPEKWNDNDEDRFEQQLLQLVLRFSRVESIIFSKTGNSKNGAGMRLSLTQSDGDELNNVIFIAQEDEDEIKKLKQSVSAMISKHKHIGLAAAYLAIWENLKINPETEGKP